MEPDARQANPAARVRLIDLRVGSDRPSLHFGARLSAILTEPGSRRAAAHAIAVTVAGPRPDDADGSVEVDGAVVSVRTLPSPLLPLGAPILVDRAVLVAQWQAWCARRRDELAIAHASGRLDRHRIEASLEQARARPAAAPEPAPDEAEREMEPSPAMIPAAEPDAQAELRVRLAALLESADAEEMPPLPEAQFLADAWAAHMVLVRACAADDEVPQRELERLEQRVDEARRALADLPQAPSEGVCAHLERSHKGVDEAEKNLIDAKRRHRTRAVARYEQAVAIELVALADAGIASYASFRVLVAAAAEADTGGRAAAEAELEAAREALEQAHMVRDVPTRRELAEREALIRSRAAELLGRPPGGDPERELRVLRVEPERNPETIEAIASVLADGGIDPADDVVGTARAFVAGVLDVPEDVGPVVTQPTAPVVTEAAAAPVVALPTVDEEEIAELEAERRAHDRQLSEIEREMARVGDLAALDVGNLDDLAPAIDALFAEYRTGALLDGMLPLVIDGVLDGTGRDARDRMIQELVGADDIQIVVVSEDPEVLQALAYLGASLVRWPESASPEASARSGA